MGRAVVVGGSIGGLMTALALSQRRWTVEVLERDPLPEVDDAEAAFACDPRAAVPQAGHSHNLFAAVVDELRRHSPGTLDVLGKAGVGQIRVRDNPPPPLAAALAGEGDEDLIGLAARRSVFEWALRRHVRSRPGVTWREAHVVGLVGDTGEVPVVRGVRLADGSTVEADLVVDASGRRSKSTAWIAELGGRDVEWEVHECGGVYYTRYYRRRDPNQAWLPLTRGVASGAVTPAYSVLALPADGDHFSLTLVAPAYVDELRALRQPETFQALMAVTPTVNSWADPGYGLPTTDVRVMAGFANAARRGATFSPYAHGFALLGDAYMHTDPTFARGVSVATMSAFALADVVTAYADPGDREAAWRTFQAEHVLSRFDDVVARNRERAQTWAAAWAGEPPVDVPFAGDVTWSDVSRASAVDEDVWRAVNRYMHVLDRFDEAITPAILEKVRAARDRGALPTMPPGPPVEQIRAILTGSLVS